MTQYTNCIAYSGHKETLEITIGWEILETIYDAIDEYRKKYKKFDKRTTEIFDSLLEIKREQEWLNHK